jgi:glucosamine kinase
VLVAGPSGEVVGRAQGGPANPRTIGAEAAWQAILTAVREALSSAGLPNEMARVRACVGLAGVGRAADRERFLSVPHPFTALRLEPDIHVALVGALGQEVGALLAVGTGSIAYAVDHQGRRYRVGGWGFEVGDEGSGAWLGREAIRAVLQHQDGRGPATSLSDAVLAAWGPTADDIVERVRTATPSDFAAWVPHVLDAAQAGDDVARRLKQRALSLLVQHLRSLERNTPPLPFSLVGSLALALADPLLALAPPRFQEGYQAPRASPVEGALLLAQQLA